MIQSHGFQRPKAPLHPIRHVHCSVFRQVDKVEEPKKDEPSVKPIDAVKDDARVGFSRGGLLNFVQKELRGFVDYLFEKGWRPNHITLASVGLTTVQGASIFFFPASTLPLLVLPMVATVRLLLDVADGLMARRYDLKTKTGAVLNEVEYVYSDIALFLPMVFIPGMPQNLWVLSVGLAVATEVVGIAARLIGNKRRYDGPLAKLSRTVLFTGAAFAVGLGAHPASWHWMEIFCGVAIVLSSLTIGNRLFRAFFERAYTRGLDDVSEAVDQRRELAQTWALKVLDEQNELKALLLESVSDGRNFSDTRDLVNFLREKIDEGPKTNPLFLVPALVRQAQEFQARARSLPSLDQHDAAFFSTIGDHAVGDYASAAQLQEAIIANARQHKPRQVLTLLQYEKPLDQKDLRDRLAKDGDFKGQSIEVQRFMPFVDSMTGKMVALRPNLVVLGNMFELLRAEEDLDSVMAQLSAMVAKGGVVVCSTVWKVDPTFYLHHAKRAIRDALPLGLRNPSNPNKEILERFMKAGFSVLDQKVTPGERLCVYVFRKD